MLRSRRKALRRVTSLREQRLPDIEDPLMRVLFLKLRATRPSTRRCQILGPFPAAIVVPAATRENLTAASQLLKLDSCHVPGTAAAAINTFNTGPHLNVKKALAISQGRKRLRFILLFKA